VELGEETPEAKGRLDLQADQDLAVEGRGRQGGVGEIDDAIDVAVEGVGEGAKGGSTQSPVDFPVPTSPVMRAGRRSWRAKVRRP
jgi:hypothetical protein